LGKNEQGSIEIIAESLSSPIEQQVVLLNNKAAAKDFIDFIKADEAQALIKGFGYGTIISNKKQNLK
jgi:molybdate transport system substrate-binding protein